MTSLLSLPRELLHEIIFYTFLPPFACPQTPGDVDPTGWVLSGLHQRSGQLRSRKNRNVGQEPITRYFNQQPLYALRQVCSQLTIEVNDVWLRRGATLTKAEVDVILDGNGDFWVTWLWIPPSAFLETGWTIEDLKIRMRIFRQDGKQKKTNNADDVAHFLSNFLHRITYNVRGRLGPEPAPIPFTFRKHGDMYKTEYVPRNFNQFATIFTDFEVYQDYTAKSLKRYPGDSVGDPDYSPLLIVEAMHCRVQSIRVPSGWGWCSDRTTKFNTTIGFLPTKRYSFSVGGKVVTEMRLRRIDAIPNSTEDAEMELRYYKVFPTAWQTGVQ